MNLTILFIAVIIVSIIVFDFWIIAKKGKQESVSAHIIRLSRQYPSIPFIAGFVAGHLWWAMNPADWLLK